MASLDYPFTENHPYPPPIDPKWQQRLTDLGGKMPGGQPRLRLVWGGERKEFWRGEQRLRYIWDLRKPKLVGFWTSDKQLLPPNTDPRELAKLVQGDQLVVITPQWDFTSDIGISRWYVEQGVPPELSTLDWDRWRYELEDGILWDELGPAPTDAEPHYENAFYMIAEHDDEVCCRLAKEEKRICFGGYRAPNDIDILYVEALLAKLKAEPFYYRWTEMPPPWVLAQRMRERKAQALKLEEDRKAEANRRVTEALRRHILHPASQFVDLGAGPSGAQASGAAPSTGDNDVVNSTAVS